jgi:hypothetical protein
VRGNNDLQRFIQYVLLEADVAAFLSDHDPSISLEGLEDPFVTETWDLGHTTNSTRSASR